MLPSAPSCAGSRVDHYPVDGLGYVALRRRLFHDRHFNFMRGSAVLSGLTATAQTAVSPLNVNLRRGRLLRTHDRGRRAYHSQPPTRRPVAMHDVLPLSSFRACRARCEIETDCLRSLIHCRSCGQVLL
jgi:hypothetical protein